MNATRTIKYEQLIPEVLQAMAAVHGPLDARGLDRKLVHLVRLRASQMNHCGFCVKMHTREARDDGETSERLDRLIVWDQVHDFDDAEKAALAWTEALTEIETKADLGALRAMLRAQFSDAEIGALTAEIAMINLWNRINVSKH